MHIKFVLVMVSLCAVSMHGVRAGEFDYGLHRCDGPHFGQRAIRVALLCAAAIGATYGVAKLAQWLFPSVQQNIFAEAQTALCMACNLYGPASELALLLVQNKQIFFVDEVSLYKLAATLSLDGSFSCYYEKLKKSISYFSDLEYSLYDYYPQMAECTGEGSLCSRVEHCSCALRSLEFLLTEYFSYFSCFTCEAELLRRYEYELALVERAGGNDAILRGWLDQAIVLRGISRQGAGDCYQYNTRLSADCECLARCIATCRGVFPSRSGAAQQLLNQLSIVHRVVTASWRM